MHFSKSVRLTKTIARSDVSTQNVEKSKQRISAHMKITDASLFVSVTESFEVCLIFRL